MSDVIGYEVAWAHTSATETYETYEDAQAAVTAVHPDAAIGHDGDIDGGGERTLCWVDEETSRDDDGVRACCSIWAQHRGER